MFPAPLHDVWRKGILVSHCPGKERHLSFVYSAVDDLKCSDVAMPGLSFRNYYPRVLTDGNHLSVNLMHHAQVCNHSSVLKVSPVQGREHVADAKRISVPICDISCGSPLGHFQLMYVGLGSSTLTRITQDIYSLLSSICALYLNNIRHHVQ